MERIFFIEFFSVQSAMHVDDKLFLLSQTVSEIHDKFLSFITIEHRHFLRHREFMLDHAGVACLKNSFVSDDDHINIFLVTPRLPLPQHFKEFDVFAAECGHAGDICS